MDHKCHKCQTTINNDDDLRKSIVTEEEQTFRDLEKTVENRIFRCRLCYYHHTKLSNIKRHMLIHYDKGEITQCASCQEAINEISIQILPDPQTEVGFSQATTRASFVCSASQQQFDSLPVSKPWLPVECPNCSKVFDYIGPLICKLMAVVYRDTTIKKEKIQRRVAVCRICLEESEDKAYMVAHAFSHIKEGTIVCSPCQEAKGISLLFEPPKEMLCLQCSKPIKDIKDLRKRLITKYVYDTGESVSVLNRAKKKQKGTMCYVCRLCLYRHRGERVMNSHLTGHYKRHEVSFCTNCQKSMDEICIGVLPDPKDRPQLLQPPCATDVVLSTKKRSAVFTTMPTPWKPVKCGKCDKAFDFLGSFLYKVIDENVQKYTDSKGNTETMEIYICRLCSVKGPRRHAMELHVSNHIAGKEALCRCCNETKEPISSEVPYKENEDHTKDLIFSDIDDLIRYNDHELEEVILTEMTAEPGESTERPIESSA